LNDGKAQPSGLAMRVGSPSLSTGEKVIETRPSKLNCFGGAGAESGGLISTLIADLGVISVEE